MIEVHHLTKRYGAHLAVEDLSFTVEQGTVYGLLGPNGAGKSTTMNILTGYISASDGAVSIDGHDILEEAEAAKACVGYLPEQPPLYLDMTAKEYLEFAARLKKVPRDQRAAQVERAMERTGVSPVSGRHSRNLSKGYRQRGGLAAALLGDPKVVILDEPTVGLDPAQVIEIRALITELGKDHTVILSSHILSEVSALCDQVLIIDKGHLVAQGTPEELARRLEGGRLVHLTALGEESTVAAILRSVPGVDEVRTRAENGRVDAEVTSGGDRDVRAEVSVALVQGGCPLLALGAETLSLEDVCLLLTSPVSIPGIVMGKYLSLLAMFAVPLGVYALYPLLMKALGAANFAASYSGLLAYFFLGAALIAVCMYLSTLTENQIVAALSGFGVLLVCYLMPAIQTLFTAGSSLALVVFAIILGAASLIIGLRSRSLVLGGGVFAVGCIALAVLFSVRSAALTTAFSAVLGALALFEPFLNFVNGLFDVTALVYYAGVAGLFLFLTGQALEKRRWN